MGSPGVARLTAEGDVDARAKGRGVDGRRCRSGEAGSCQPQVSRRRVGGCRPCGLGAAGEIRVRVIIWQEAVGGRGRQREHEAREVKVIRAGQEGEPAGDCREGARPDVILGHWPGPPLSCATSALRAGRGTSPQSAARARPPVRRAPTGRHPLLNSSIANGPVDCKRYPSCFFFWRVTPQGLRTQAPPSPQRRSRRS